MKFALCLSGHLRTFPDVLLYFKQNLIDPLNCDVFIHTWDVMGAPTGKNPGDIANTTNKTVNYLNSIYNICNIKQLLIENDNTSTRFIEQTRDIQASPQDQQFIMKHIGYHVSMFYSIYMANKLKIQHEQIHGFIYDRVIRCRPDVRLGTIFHPNMFPDNNSIYLPKIATYCQEGVNDQMAIGSSQIIDSYSNIYNDIIDYYRNPITTCRPEALIKYHLNKNNISINKINIDYDIYRLDGGILRQHEMWAEMLGVRWR